MPRNLNGDPIQMYEDPYDPIVSFSSPFANFVYEPHPTAPNYWVAAREKTAAEMGAEDAATKLQKTRTAARKQAKAKNDDQRTALYRIRSASSDLLYIGISSNPPKRWLQHAADKPWWQEAADFSIEWFESRTEALAMEALAIKSERPLHNVVHNADLRPAA